MTTTTTIKVPTDLRDRINQDAREQDTTAAGLLEKLIDAYERRARMEEFGRAFRRVDEAYWDEFHAWDIVVDDGDEGEDVSDSIRVDDTIPQDA